MAVWSDTGKPKKYDTVPFRLRINAGHSGVGRGQRGSKFRNSREKKYHGTNLLRRRYFIIMSVGLQPDEATYERTKNDDDTVKDKVASTPLLKKRSE